MAVLSHMCSLMRSGWPALPLLRSASSSSVGGSSNGAMMTGQPTPHSHPHLLSAQELTPGMPETEYKRRRWEFAQQHLRGGDLAIIPAGDTKFISGVIPYPFRQDASFYYMTGITQPKGVALLEYDADADDCLFSLFIDIQSAEEERWDGPALSLRGAVDIFGAHEAHSLHSLEREVRGRLMRRQGSYVIADRGKLEAAQLLRLSPTLSSAFQQGKTIPFEQKIDRLRWVKSEAEVEIMRRAASISARAFNSCIDRFGVGDTEHQVMTHFAHTCMNEGAQHMAYPPVCARGPNGVAIHYAANNDMIRKGDLFLMDAGCELEGYASDITRTWAVDGQYTSAQRAVMDIVLSCLHTCLSRVAEGATLQQLHNISVEELSRGLIELGVCSGTVSQVMSSNAYRPFYPHMVGHWLGLNTHDTPSVSGNTAMEEGVVLTLEPGLYFSERNLLVPPHLRGIGVRVEDDILVGRGGHCEVLTREVPQDL